MTDATHLLIVDDEPLYRELLSTRFKRAGYRIAEAADGATALAVAAGQDVDVALVDIRMPGMDGVELLRRLKELDRLTEVIILTGHGNVDSAISAMKLGAFDYLSKPYKLSELDLVIERALERRRLTQRCAGLSAEVQHLRGRSDGAGIGDSPAWQQTLAMVRKAAELDIPVLITGESGTGKELIASALHRWGKRNGNAFVPLNCALLQESLLESELFGHKKGAFTGAVSDKEGLFQTADHGTLFLDEIGELPASSQAKLLRVLETREFRPIGGTVLRYTDARVIAATHRDLEQQVEEQTFRQDLYYRLNVLQIRVPPLRERREDIPALVQSFLRNGSLATANPPRFTVEALTLLADYPWPGNVRELKNVVERIQFLIDGDVVETETIHAVLSGHSKAPSRQPEATGFSQIMPLAELERCYVNWVLERHDGNLSAASRALNVSRSTVYRILQETERA
jgi:DNA-binding NtrC family response regulator